MHVSGVFPDFRSTQLTAADECTWHDDADTSKDFVLMPDEARALFLVTTWGVSAHSRESRAVPLTPAAEAMCQRPLPKGWAIIIPGHDLGGATTKDDYVQEGTLERYLCNLAAGRRPSAISLAQRREALLVRLAAAADHLRTLAGRLDGFRTRHHVLYRTGGVWSTFSGTDSDLARELSSLNEHDHHGHTEVHASFDTKEEAEEEYCFQTEGQDPWVSPENTEVVGGVFCDTVSVPDTRVLMLQLALERNIEVTSGANDTPHT